MYPYSVWLLSHSAIMLRCICVVEYISTIKSTICLHIHVWIVMWVVSISSLLQIDLRWTCMCESVQTLTSFLFGKSLGINRLNYGIGVCLTLLRICQLFSKVSVPFTSPLEVYQSSSCSVLLPFVDHCFLCGGVYDNLQLIVLLKWLDLSISSC